MFKSLSSGSAPLLPGPSWRGPGPLLGQPLPERGTVPERLFLDRALLPLELLPLEPPYASTLQGRVATPHAGPSAGGRALTLERPRAASGLISLCGRVHGLLSPTFFLRQE